MNEYPKLLGFLSIIVIFALASCQYKEFHSKRNLDFNLDWKFIEDSVIGAEATDFEVADWINVDLPHDWSIRDYPVQDSVHIGPFYKNIALGHDVGYLRGGTGWYRKVFAIDPINAGKEVILHFDGIMGESVLWVNGQKVREHVYGYTPFSINITDFLKAPGEKNVIGIRVYKPMENSRWFTGAGIYRSVEISYLDQVHVDTWGLGIKTQFNSENHATVELDVKIVNKNNYDRDIIVLSEIVTPDGQVLTVGSDHINLPEMGKGTIDFSITIDNPTLWHPDDPQIYKARISLNHLGTKLDEYIQDFGIRKIEYTVDQGFLLNGEKILLKGACMHHDNGLLGAAAFRKAEERRVRIMKENGYNAIRTSHNPPSKYFLEACDKLGMLVIDEAFDMWIKPKRKNDYHRFFEQWWEKDLKSMIMRDRNHPSIIMWSFGNEVQERADSSGVAIGKNCISTIRSIDDTRPITQAVCGFWDNPGKEWDDSAPAFEILDIGGYNYQWANYEKDHEKHPGRIMYGSESVPNEAFDNWQLVENLSWVIGDFVWTGMDYIGESGIGHSIYPKPEDERTFLMPWPTYISWCGDIDITGNKKPQSYYRDILWDESNLEILVHEPYTSGVEEVTSFWGWPNELPSWNWEGHEGEMLEVNVYSSYPKVRLELNSELIGEAAVSESSRFTAKFKVAYQPGELVAMGMENNEIREEKVIHTSSESRRVELIAEEKEIDADRAEVAYIQVASLDKNGTLVNTSSEAMRVKVEGPAELIAAGNANPELDGSIRDDRFKLFRGRGLIVVRSTGVSGNIIVSVGGEVTPDEIITIVAE